MQLVLCKMCFGQFFQKKLGEFRRENGFVGCPMAKKKLIGLVGQSEATCMFITCQLLQFIGDFAEVLTWCMDENSTPPIHFENASVYLISNHSVYDAARCWLPIDKKCIIANRAVNIEKLGNILDVDYGENALVVATTEETSNNTIDILNTLGVDYLNLYSYWPNCNKTFPAGIQLAITTGLVHLVPPYIKKVINLGGKGIDVSSFADILYELGLPTVLLKEFSNYYLKAILENNIRIRHIAEQNEKLGQNMARILDNVVEAIIAIDTYGKIVLSNPAVEKIFQQPQNSLIGMDVSKIIPNFEQYLLNVDKGDQEHIIFLDNQHYILKNYPLGEKGSNIATWVTSLLPTETVQELDKKVRRELHRRANSAKYSFSDICGKSAIIQSTIHLAKKFSKTDMTILLEGESGTGKELFAQSIHNFSDRKNGPFVAVNFASMPEHLIESELFGYVEGAFTGAKKGGKAGLFEEAHTGTIFLDEIGSALPDMQKRLLRVLEEREIRRVGSNQVISVDVRVITASNVKLQKLVDTDSFRLDLFYRICAAPLTLPALRKRKEDILFLVGQFADNLHHELKLSPELIDFFMNYKWPGNIRELQNIISYICSLVTSGKYAYLEHLPTYIIESAEETELPKRPLDNKIKLLQSDDDFKNIIKNPLNRNLTLSLLEALRQAEVLNKNIGRKTLQKSLASDKINMTEYQVKAWLKILCKVGYIEQGTTRQGSKLTEKGRQFILFMEQNF